jgi:hypothetical protein
MNRFILRAIIALVLCLPGNFLLAKTEIIPLTCDNNFKDAYIGVDVDRTGKVIRRYGVDCNGEHWINEGRPVVQMGSDPEWSYTFTFTGESNGGTWWVKIQMGTDNQPAKIWGKDVAGNFWDYTG